MGEATLTLDGKTVLAPVTGGHAVLELPVERPRLWSAEAPELYTYEVTLTDAAGHLLETVRGKAGFRRFELGRPDAAQRQAHRVQGREPP